MATKKPPSLDTVRGFVDQQAKELAASLAGRGMTRATSALLVRVMLKRRSPIETHTTGKVKQWRGPESRWSSHTWVPTSEVWIPVWAAALAGGLEYAPHERFGRTHQSEATEKQAERNLAALIVVFEGFDEERRDALVALYRTHGAPAVGEWLKAHNHFPQQVVR